MTGYDVRTRCRVCGTWYWAGLGHTCPPTAPTNLLPITAGTTYRFHVVDHNTLILRAVLKHEAAPELEGASA